MTLFNIKSVSVWVMLLKYLPGNENVKIQPLKTRPVLYPVKRLSFK